jgi:predicted metalloprotease with PDZ domain
VISVLGMGTQKVKELEETSLQQIPPDADQSAGDSYVLGIHAIHDGESREAVVAQVDYPSPAFDAGLHVGDQLLTISGSAVTQLDRQGLSALLTPNGPTNVVLEIARLNREMTFTVRPVTRRASLATIGQKPSKLGRTPQTCSDS